MVYQGIPEVLSMVTIAEIEAKEKEVEEEERTLTTAGQQLQPFLVQKIPQRRYGTGVTPKQQQTIIKQKEEARQKIEEIAKYKEALQKYRGELAGTKAEVQAYESQKREYEQNLQDYEVGKKFALKGRFPFFANEWVRRGYRDQQADLQAYEERRQQLQSLKEAGLKPIYSGGKLAGFEDIKLQMSYALESLPKILSKKPSEIEKFKKLDIIETTMPESPQGLKGSFVLEATPQPTGALEKELYDIQRRASLLETKKLREGLTPQEKVELTLKGAGASIVSQIISLKEFPERRTQQVISLPKNLKELFAEPTATYEKLKQKFKVGYEGGIATIGTTLYQRPEYSTGYAGGEILTMAGYSKGLSQLIKFANKPISLKKELKLPEQITAETKVINLRIGEEPINIAQIQIKTFVFPQKEFTIARWRKYIQPIQPKIKTELLSFPELKQLYPYGKIKELRKPSIVYAVSEPFLIKEGRIVGSLRGTKGTGILTAKGTLSYLTKQTRISPLVLSKLEGETYNTGKLLRLIERGKLPKTTQKQIEELEKLSTKTGFETRIIFPKETELSVGRIKITDILKLTKKELKTIGYGRRTTRAELSILQKQLGLTQFETKEFGLKEYEKLAERLGVTEETYPRIPRVTKEGFVEIKPKKAKTIKGIVERYEYEYPSQKPLGEFVKGIKPTRTERKILSQIQKEITLETTQKSLSGLAIQQKRFIKTRIPRERVGVPSSQSLYYGLGLYELTDVGFVKDYKEIIKETPKEVQKETGQLIYKESPKYITKEIAKYTTKEITRTMPKEITKQLPKYISKQTAKEITKQITKQITKETAKPVVKIPRMIITKEPTPPPIIPYPKLKPTSEKELKQSLAYLPFVIRKGRREYISSRGLPKGKALRLAETQAIKTLRATFGAEPTLKKTSEKDVGFAPLKIFRPYRIRKGKRIPLKDTYIQRLGERLRFKGEIAEIQKARRLKGGIIKIS